MSIEYFTYRVRLPEVTSLNPAAGVLCGLICLPACDGEADTLIILPGPGELSPTSSAALPIHSHDITGETITWSFNSMPPLVSMNFQTDFCTDSHNLPD